MTASRETLFKTADYNAVLEISLRPKPLFSGGLDSSCLAPELWKTMAMTVPSKSISRRQSLNKNNPKILNIEIQEIM